MEKMVISSVKTESGLAQLTIVGLVDEIGAIKAVFRELSEEKIVIDMILQSPGKDGKVDVIFTISKDMADLTEDVLMAAKNKLRFDSIRKNKKLAKVTLTGSGLMSHSDIVPRVLSCFNECNAPMDVISTSEIAIKVFTDVDKAARAVELLREEFDDYGL